MANGIFYNDLLVPFIIADQAAVTLSTTLKALYTTSAVQTGQQMFALTGKKYKLRAFGKITTAATPGNLVVSLLYGTGADANGVTLASSAAVALVASQTNISWECELYISCRSTGSTGTLFVDGAFRCNPAVIASTAQPVMIPASAAVVSGSCDLTSSSLLLSLQASRSGSTAETMTVQDIELIALN